MPYYESASEEAERFGMEQNERAEKVMCLVRRSQTLREVRRKLHDELAPLVEAGKKANALKKIKELMTLAGN